MEPPLNHDFSGKIALFVSSAVCKFMWFVQANVPYAV